MALGIVTVNRNAMLDALAARIDLGAGPGKVRIYDGSRPATGGAATTLLAELTMTDPCSAGAASASLTLNAITRDSSADASGTATWFRVLDSNNNIIFDGNVTASGGGGDMQLVTVTIVAGQPVEISSFAINMANA